jgi:hypothetical protein
MIPFPVRFFISTKIALCENESQNVVSKSLGVLFPFDSLMKIVS